MMVTRPRRASGREQGEGESAKKCSPSGFMLNVEPEEGSMAAFEELEEERSQENP